MASFESTRARMSIKHILNFPLSQEPDYSAFPGHPHFSNGSMPMTMLLESPAELPIANQWAEVQVFGWGQESIPSPDYAPSASLPTRPEPRGEQPVGATSAEASSYPSSSSRAQIFSPKGTPNGPWLHPSSPALPSSLSPFQFAPTRPLLTSPSWPDNVSPTSEETDLNTARYEDGEVLRYGAGESYRPFNNNGNNNTNNRDRSPPRRVRSPLLRDRDRDQRPRTPPVTSDSYVPGRSPRRRSRSADRYRGPDRARDNVGGESWRRRDNSRSRVRSPVRRPSPPARRSPRRSPPRFSPAPRRDDRFDRARSPRRDFDNRDIR